MYVVTLSSHFSASCTYNILSSVAPCSRVCQFIQTEYTSYNQCVSDQSVYILYNVSDEQWELLGGLPIRSGETNWVTYITAFYLNNSYRMASDAFAIADVLSTSYTWYDLTLCYLHPNMSSFPAVHAVNFVMLYEQKQ